MLQIAGGGVMRYPRLVPEHLCKTPCIVTLYGEGLEEDGSPEILFQKELYCNYQDCAKTLLTAQKKFVQITGTAYFSCDIAPDVPVISAGTFTVFGVTREIQQGTKARNPDGTVNYTMLEVI